MRMTRNLFDHVDGGLGRDRLAGKDNVRHLVKRPVHGTIARFPEFNLRNYF
jgi:hypothetical protein